MRESGHGIFINGIPSSGKSSVAAEIVRRTPSFSVLTGDDIIREVPEAVRLLEAQSGRLFRRTLDTLEQKLKAANVIMDGAWTKEQVAEAQDRFGDAGLFVVLRIDESERRRRESARRDRQLGHWHESFHQMPGPDGLYDLVLDSQARSVFDCADAILEAARQAWGEPP